MRLRHPLPVLLLCSALALSACGGDDDEGPAIAADGVLGGPGVTADTITLASLTDASGPFKELSLNIRAGEDLWVADVNAAGGVCGRRIQVEVRDHGYKAEQAKVQFSELEPESAGFLELLGSPMIAALKGDIDAKKITSVAVSWSSEVLDQPYVLIAGTTYDLEIINALSYLLAEGEIAKGDTIGHIYIDGEYGGNGLRGSQFFTKAHGMKLVAKKVTPTDTDMTSIVTGLKGDKVSAIALTSSSPQLGSAASANKALGLNVPLVGNAPVFSPSLMDTPAAGALDKLIVAASVVPFGAKTAKATEVAGKYTAAYEQLPSYAVNYGYAVGLIWQQILERACAAKDLSRAGIFAAKNASTTVDTAGLIVDLDLSKPGAPPSREVYLATPDKAMDGRLRQIGEGFESQDAKAYLAPHQG
ncbi:MAG: ABC transporter substrate-binding protein [Sporichthyaceae bacterium]